MRKLKAHIALIVIVFQFYFIGNAQVSEQTIKDHIYYLASEELNGRIAGTEEGRMAAEYIVDELKSNSLTVFSDSGQYYQDFTHSNDVKKPSLIITDQDSFAVVHINKMMHFNKRKPIRFITQQQQLDCLSDSGAYVIVNAEKFDEGMQLIKKLHLQNGGSNGYVLLLPDKKNRSYRIGLKHLKKADNTHEVFVITNYLKYARDKEDCESYLKEFEHLNILVANQKRFKAKAEPMLMNEQNLILEEDKDSLIVNHYRNVIAKIEGKQTGKPAIVFCAHYDHVDSTAARRTKTIAETDYYPGADDNASGTAAVIEIAKQLKKRNYQPQQDVYFCLFDAEEQGLYGSRHFAKNIDQDVDLVINMDMIGRNKRDRKRCDNIIFAKGQGKTGKDFIKGFDKYCRENAESLKIRRYDMELMLLLMGYPSDQASFRPDSDTSVFYTGLHKDYHTHNDTPDKINYKKLTEYINMMSGYLMSR